MKPKGISCLHLDGTAGLSYVSSYMSTLNRNKMDITLNLNCCKNLAIYYRVEIYHRCSSTALQTHHGRAGEEGRMWQELSSFRSKLATRQLTSKKRKRHFPQVSSICRQDKFYHTDTDAYTPSSLKNTSYHEKCYLYSRSFCVCFFSKRLSLNSLDLQFVNAVRNLYLELQIPSPDHFKSSIRV